MLDTFASGRKHRCVETPRQLAFLREHHCDAVQGFLYSVPVAPEAVATLLAEKLRIYQ